MYPLKLFLKNEMQKMHKVALSMRLFAYSPPPPPPPPQPE